MANMPDAADPAVALWLAIEDHWRRVTDLARSFGVWGLEAIS